MNTEARSASAATSAISVEDLRLHGDVQRRGRLVEDDQVRLADQRAGDADPLRLAAGQLVRVALEDRAVQLHPVQHGGDPRVPFAPGQASGPQRLGDGVADRTARAQRADRVLEDELGTGTCAPQRPALGGGAGPVA